MSQAPRAVGLAVLAIAAVHLGGGVGAYTAVGQTPPAASDAKAVAEPASSQEFERHVTKLVNDLRSDQFAVREQASEQLFRIGPATLPTLRSIRRQSNDTEQSDRLDRIIESLAKQNLESRIRSFLQGGPSELENWPEFEKWFGDSPPIRELFVDLYREHPDLVDSLGGTPQQLSMGLSRVHRRLIERGVGPREVPQRIDLLALLLPMTDPNFQAGPQYDLIVASLLQLYPANDFRKDAVFGKPFMRIVATWMARSDLSIREQVLRLALQWKMDIGLTLALETLQQNPDPILLCRCMQTIARQGTPKHASLLAVHIHDSTVVFQKRYVGVHGSEVQVGDVAAATIAFLHSVPVTEIGFAEPAEHPIFGIIYEELVVPMKAPVNVGDKSDQDAANDDDATPDPADDGDEQVEAELDEDDLTPLQRGRLTPREIARLIDQAKRREESRIEIRLKALELLPTTPAEMPQKS
ncbi:hypothetical protein Mal15_01790 [Stieleria maiorica]|uniref:Uncharacterized protein n=1 Tax=Stieleria maiorica TaxID=2795974 RepID=A0A5B9M562_9BACT|nr:hypothetical protein [Stieleria maiorica]QEF96152.1 hypothetical protein Mal15_01790 [Stieleria maiorica]